MQPKFLTFLIEAASASDEAAKIRAAFETVARKARLCRAPACKIEDSDMSQLVSKESNEILTLRRRIFAKI